MKKYIKYIAIISFANLLAFTRVHAQQLAKSDTWVKTWADTANYKSVAPELIADETTISYTKHNAQIECNNEEIAHKILKRYYQLIKSCVMGAKKDMHGNYYKYYLIQVSKKDVEIIKSWAKSNL